jgi:hypothetical protein
VCVRELFCAPGAAAGDRCQGGGGSHRTATPTNQQHGQTHTCTHAQALHNPRPHLLLVRSSVMSAGRSHSPSGMLRWCGRARRRAARASACCVAHTAPGGSARQRRTDHSTQCVTSASAHSAALRAGSTPAPAVEPVVLRTEHAQAAVGAAHRQRAHKAVALHTSGGACGLERVGVRRGVHDGMAATAAVDRGLSLHHTRRAPSHTRTWMSASCSAEQSRRLSVPPKLLPLHGRARARHA